MRVDSFTYLPRSFRARFERPAPVPGEDAEVWAPFEPRLADATIGLLSSAGLYLEGVQDPFDVERERNEPMWGDPSWRAIPHDVAQGGLGMSHLHVNPADVLADHEVALPVRTLDALVSDGIVGASAGTHVSVMGYQEAGLVEWRERTPPAGVELHRDRGGDGAGLPPV